jgi:hypothetical protein
MFLLGGYMSGFMSLPFHGASENQIATPAEMFAQMAQALVYQWPGKLAFACGAAALCVIYLLLRRTVEKHSARGTAAFLILALAIGMGIFFVRDAIGTPKHKKENQEAYAHGFYVVSQRMPTAKSFVIAYANDRESLHKDWVLHIWSNMPGKTLLYYAFVRIGLNLKGIEEVNILLSALAAAPLFFVARRLFSARVAAGAVLLFYLFPGVPGVFPAFNTMTALFAMVGLGLALVCLDRKDPAIGVLTGIYLALFFLYEPLPFVLVLFLLPYIWRAFRRDAVATGVMLAGMAIGFAGFFVGFYFWSGVSIIKISLDTIRCAQQFNVEFHRAYAPHLLVNVVEFSRSIGGVAFILMAFGISRSGRELFSRGGSFFRRFFVETPATQAVGVFAFLVMTAVLEFSGANRAETWRLWVFLMPLAGACAIWGAEKLELEGRMPFVVGLLCAQGILAHIGLMT